MLLLITITLIGLANVHGFEQRDAMDYFDNLLSSPLFAQEIAYSKLDPYALPNITKTFNDSALRANLTNGRLENLSRIRRFSGCSVPQWEFANVTFTCYLRFDNLTVNYSTQVSYRGQKHSFFSTASVTGTNLTAQVTTAHYDNVPSLRLLFINHMGRVNVTTRAQLGGNGTQILSPIRSVLSGDIVRRVHDVVNNRFRNALAFTIYKTPVKFA